ncbi:hypothetical protein AAG747_03665 [Rapidithrix thailandica]|uniref:Uncharacterized protein n=1 Tax=Rapidithrix thailandica TaxID=413964 RepID=A0AAW9S3M0_9BACT
MSSISGGIVVKMEDEFPIEPTCCGDLGNLLEWENIFKEGTEKWQPLWIGHPWIFYRKTNNKIEFSDYFETNIEALGKVQACT